MSDNRELFTTSQLDLALDAVCDEFERGLKQGEPPNLSATIANYPYPNKTELFRELVLLQLAYTRTEKQQELLEQWIAQFPEHLELLLDILVVQTKKTGRPPAPQSSTRSAESASENQTARSSGGPPVARERVAHYRILQRLGVGGFGTVYLAHDERLGRIVALKVPHNYDCDEERERFVREVKNAARLDHPGIVRVYDSGEADGMPYFAMEYVRGASLKNDCAPESRGSKSECRRIVTLVCEIAQALAHAHARGITHRDLKPANILMDDTGRPHISDFGLAKRDVGEFTLTGAGKLIGTLGYMAPEQAGVGAHYVDARADIYSLGVIFFELLTGHLPFAGTPAAVLTQLLNSEPPAPSRLVPGISPELDTICLRCLEKRPACRYGSVELLADDLQRWLAGRPISVRPVGPFGKLNKAVRRHPVVAGLATALSAALLSLAGLGALAYWQATAAKRSFVLGAVRTLRHASAEAVPAVLQDLEPIATEISAAATSALANSTISDPEQVRLALAVDELNSSTVSKLMEAGLRAPLSEQPLYRLALSRHATRDTRDLWNVLKDERQQHEIRLRAAVLLSATDPTHEDWNDWAPTIATLLLKRESSELRLWLAQWQPCPAPITEAIRQQFLAELSTQNAAIALFELNLDQPQNLATLFIGTLPAQGNELLKCLRSSVESLPQPIRAQLHTTLRNNVNLGTLTHTTPILALAILGDDQPLLAGLSVTVDQTVRTQLMIQLAETATAAELLQKLSLAEQPDHQQALLVVLGERLRSEAGFTEPSLEAWLQKYLASSDSGVHVAAAWALSQREQESPQSVSAKLDAVNPEWYRTPLGATMILIDPSVRPADAPSVAGPEHAYYLASTELTVEQFAQASGAADPTSPADARIPVGDVTFQQVASYCNWYSKSAGIPESQWCYLQQADSTLELAPDFLVKSGYRLPTRAEWDFACHGYTSTRHAFGDQTQRIARFGWYLHNSDGRRQVVQSLWPDRRGLFDLLGNVMEMCHNEPGSPYPICFMGGSALARPEGLGLRNAFETYQSSFDMGGFRIARSVVPRD